MSKQPVWLNEFVDRVCSCLRPVEDMPPIGCHYTCEDETWEISIFVSPTEIVGGQHDGERFPCVLTVDLLDLLPLFDVVEVAGWQPHPHDDSDELRNHISIEGYYAGQQIWLRILAHTPDIYAPGRYLNAFDQHHNDTW